MMTNNLTLASNTVPSSTLREVQIKVLENLSEILSNSFGPKGSTTCIKKENALNIYTKDGYNILKNIYYHGIIEQSIKDDIESITRYIVKTVGDGTTSAVILSNMIFKEFIKNEDIIKYHPSDILQTLKEVVNDIKDIINKNASKATNKDYYDIAMISSDGNKEIATNIANIYYDHGDSVFIDVSISNTSDSILKTYDGLTLDSGFCDSSFINNKVKGTCDIRNANIYFFEDPIDTPEMAQYVETIAYTNIFGPLQTMVTDKTNNMKKSVLEVIPTVIIAPHISRDLTPLMDHLITQFAQTPAATRPPLCIINDIHDMDTYADIIKLCGGKSFKKYIDPKIQQADIDAGRCPTVENCFTWCGFAEQVEADANMTKIINPANLKKDDGSYSDIYNEIINYLETSLKKAYEDGEDNNVTGNLKRRINSLKGNMVEYLVGGISPSDRDAARDLVEDTVLNCRSASKYGVGYAANFEAYKASISINTDNKSKLYKTIVDIIHDAYTNLIKKLFEMSLGKNEDAERICEDCLRAKRPINLRTLELDDSAKSSIESDIIILDSVVKIIGIMFTTNQFIVPSPAHNVYVDYNN